MIKSYNTSAMKLNQFAFLRAFGRGFSSQIEPPNKCFFNSMKDIVGYEGLYAVTEDGRIWSYPKNKNKFGIKTGCFLIGNYTRGYASVNLINRGRKRVQIHRLVASAFIPNPENKPHVNHKNGVHDDNRVENLEWYTPSENELHSYRVLGKKPNTKHLDKYRGRNSIKIVQLSLGGEYINEFPSGHKASKILGFSQGNICMCLLGKRPTAHGYLWKYYHEWQHTKQIPKMNYVN